MYLQRAVSVGSTGIVTVAGGAQKVPAVSAEHLPPNKTNTYHALVSYIMRKVPFLTEAAMIQK